MKKKLLIFLAIIVAIAAVTFVAYLLFFKDKINKKEYIILEVEEASLNINTVVYGSDYETSIHMAKGTFANILSDVNDDIAYISTRSDVAYISQEGTITAIKEGTTTVYAYYKSNQDITSNEIEIVVE